MQGGLLLGVMLCLGHLFCLTAQYEALRVARHDFLHTETECVEETTACAASVRVACV